jgi:hypothetical protein
MITTLSIAAFHYMVSDCFITCKWNCNIAKEYAAITGSIGLTPSPIAEATGLVGRDAFG